MTPEYGPPALIAKLARASAEGMDLLEKRIEMLVDHRVRAETERCAGLARSKCYCEFEGRTCVCCQLAAAIREGEKDGE